MVMSTFTNCGVDINTILRLDSSKLVRLVELPNRIAVGLENQLVAHRVKGDAPVLTFGVIGMTERAEEIGVVAMSIFVLVADADRLNAIDVDFHL